MLPACDGVAAVVALGTGRLAVRIDRLPVGIKTLQPTSQWTFTLR
jgi:hypothetical protein